MRSSGIATSPKSSVRTRHDSTVVQDARSAMPAMRSCWGSVLHEALIDAAPADDGGPALHQAELLPRGVEAVARAEGDRAPARSRSGAAARRCRAGRAGGGPRRRRRARSPGSTRRGAAAGGGTAGRGRRGRRRPDRAGRRARARPATAVSGAGEWSSCTTASASSSGMVLASAAVGVPLGLAAVARRGDQADGVAVVGRWIAIDAAADTAPSSELAAPCPRWAVPRLSRNTVARDCHGCSSRRTISSPTRAELRQWTRRRSSPRRYSRTVTSSALPVAKARGRLSPEPGPGATERDARQGDRARGDGEARRGVERAAELDEAEGVGDPHRHRADLELSAQLGAHLVGRVPAPAVARGPPARSAGGCRGRRGGAPRAAARPWACATRWRR